MAEGYQRTRITYQLGVGAAIVAFVLKAVTFTTAGAELVMRIGVTPRNFVEASALLFLLCIANEAYASALLRKGHGA